MKLRAFRAFKSKFIKPCSKFFAIFKLKLNKQSLSLRPSRFRRRRLRTKAVRFKQPFSIRKLHLPRCRPKKASTLNPKRPIGRRIRLHRRRPNNGGHRFGKKMSKLVSVFRPTKRSKELESVLLDFKGMSETGMGNGAGKEPFPSPITPAFVRAIKESVDNEEEEVEDACRSFESYLVEMIVEDGKLKDLVDVEELLHCSRTLKSPVFVDLVCRFYGDVCKDLFASDGEEETGEEETDDDYV